MNPTERIAHLTKFRAYLATVAQSEFRDDEIDLIDAEIANLRGEIAFDDLVADTMMEGAKWTDLQCDDYSEMLNPRC